MLVAERLSPPLRVHPAQAALGSQDSSTMQLRVRDLLASEEDRLHWGNLDLFPGGTSTTNWRGKGHEQQSMLSSQRASLLVSLHSCPALLSIGLHGRQGHAFASSGLPVDAVPEIAAAGRGRSNQSQHERQRAYTFCLR